MLQKITVRFLTEHTSVVFFFVFFNDTATTEIYTLSLHDALPIYFHKNFHFDWLLLCGVVRWRSDDRVRHSPRGDGGSNPSGSDGLPRAAARARNDRINSASLRDVARALLWRAQHESFVPFPRRPPRLARRPVRPARRFSRRHGAV